MPTVTTMPATRYVADPQDTLEIVAEARDRVVLKIQARNNRLGRTEQFEFEINSRQIQALLTWGCMSR